MIRSGGLEEHPGLIDYSADAEADENHDRGDANVREGDELHVDADGDEAYLEEQREKAH